MYYYIYMYLYLRYVLLFSVITISDERLRFVLTNLYFIFFLFLWCHMTYIHVGGVTHCLLNTVIYDLLGWRDSDIN